MKPSTEPSSFLDIVLRTINKFNMIEPGDKIVVGVSGGPDSVALINILCSLSRKIDFVAIVAHVNHNLRPSSLAERDFVARIALQHGLDFFDHDAHVKAYAEEQKLSVEEAGRRIRYSFFEKLLKKLNADKIATAHHIDDQIETFFLRLFRGTTITGLRGIPSVRGSIIRPLIRLERSRIIEYLEANGIPYLIDETNSKPDTDRNFIRNVILGYASDRFPHYRRSILRSIELLGRDEDFLERWANQLYNSAVVKLPQLLTIDIKQIIGVHDSISSRVIRKALYELVGPNIRLSEIHLSNIINLASGCNPSSEIDLPGTIKVERNYDRLIIRKVSKNRVSSYSHIVSEPGILKLGETGFMISFSIRKAFEYSQHSGNDPHVEFFDLDFLSFPMEVRSFLPGDRIEPWGMEGSTKIKKIFIDRKISAEARRNIPLIVKDNKILWIAGIRRSRFFGVTSASVNVMEIRLIDDVE